MISLEKGVAETEIYSGSISLPKETSGPEAQILRGPGNRLKRPTCFPGLPGGRAGLPGGRGHANGTMLKEHTRAFFRVTAFNYLFWQIYCLGKAAETSALTRDCRRGAPR